MLCTLFFNSLLQYILKPLTGQWKTYDRGVRLAEHDPDTNLSNLRFADDILLIDGSLKHSTTMLDDLTTATTAYGHQLHTTKTQIISSSTSKRGRGNTVAVQAMNIDIIPPEGKIKYIGQLISCQKTP